MERLKLRSRASHERLHRQRTLLMTHLAVLLDPEVVVNVCQIQENHLLMQEEAQAADLKRGCQWHQRGSEQ